MAYRVRLSARLVFSARKRPFNFAVTRPSPQGIEYRLAVLVHRCQQGLAPSYLSIHLHRVSDVLILLQYNVAGDLFGPFWFDGRIDRCPYNKQTQGCALHLTRSLECAYVWRHNWCSFSSKGKVGLVDFNRLIAPFRLRQIKTYIDYWTYEAPWRKRLDDLITLN